MMQTRWPAIILAALLLMPVIGGVLSVLLPAFGYLPALNSREFSLEYFKLAVGLPNFLPMLGLTLVSGLISTLLAVLMTLIIIAHLYNRGVLNRTNRWFRPLLVVPHAAVAIAFGFLIAPSGFVLRLLSPSVTGFELPPSWPLPNDPYGIVMTLALAIKEMPFLLLLSVAILDQVQRKQKNIQQVKVAQTLGYSSFSSCIYVLWPQLYPLIRLPVFAVLIYTGSSIEIPLILGPSMPTTISVSILSASSDVNLNQRFIASALSVMQVLVSIASVLIWLLIERSGRLARNVAMQPSVAKRVFFIGNLLGRVILVFTMGVISLAIVALIMLSLSGHWAFGSPIPSSFTLIHWQFAISQLYAPIINSVWIAFSVTIFSLVLCLLAMESIAKSKRAIRTMALVNYVPLLFPMIVFMFGAAVLINQFMGNYTVFGVLILHFVIVTPYMWLSLSQQYFQLDPRLIQVAKTLGANDISCFFKVKLPLLWSTVMVAMALGISISLSQYLPTLLGGAGAINTLTTEAVALASGGSRRLTAVYAIIQIIMPALVFALLTANWKRKPS